MRNALQVFSFQSSEILTKIDEKGEIWFQANHVCDALGYSNSRKAIDDHVSPEDVTKRDTLSTGGSQQTNFINESGLYSLIFGSKKPQAKEFKRWVTSEVLPSIRKTGSYEHAPKHGWPLVTEDARAYHDLAVLLGNSQSVAKAETVQFIGREHNKDVKHLLKNNVADVQRPLLTATQLGARIGKSAQTMNLILQGEGFQKKEDKSWIPTEKAVGHYEALDVGKSRSNGTPVRQIKWYDSVLKSLQSA